MMMNEHDQHQCNQCQIFLISSGKPEKSLPIHIQLSDSLLSTRPPQWWWTWWSSSFTSAWSLSLKNHFQSTSNTMGYDSKLIHHISLVGFNIILISTTLKCKYLFRLSSAVLDFTQWPILGLHSFSKFTLVLAGFSPSINISFFSAC